MYYFCMDYKWESRVFYLRFLEWIMVDVWERLKNWFVVFFLVEMLVSIRKGYCFEG